MAWLDVNDTIFSHAHKLVPDSGACGISRACGVVVVVVLAIASKCLGDILRDGSGEAFRYVMS